MTPAQSCMQQKRLELDSKPDTLSSRDPADPVGGGPLSCMTQRVEGNK